MATELAPTKPTAPPRTYSPLAAFLSYLVPGLGQIVQGRVGKGVLFLVCLYGLFFYGMALGHWQNVYVPSSPPPKEGRRSSVLDAITDRARFAGQFWIGVAAWPALLQHFAGTPYVEMPDGSRGKIVLVENAQGYDLAVRSPRTADLTIKEQDGSSVEVERNGQRERYPVKTLPLLGSLMSEPDEGTVNRQMRNADKKFDVGWMYTVIAGVLNILVIYDAFAGAFFGTRPSGPQGEEGKEAENKTEERATP
ncbi:MAG: hypothetical protein L0Z62_09775 [Gemmataceae bacterium]|nr:hypothetical protein [Gemmataceae bacterium]